MELKERLARMWIECDPNRGGPGCEPDEDITMFNDDGTERPAKRWEWFVPRAEATLEYLEKHGLRIVSGGDG